MNKVILENRNPLKIGICITFNPVFTHIFRADDIAKDFHEFSQTGLRGIELSIRDTDDIDWPDFNLQLKKNKLELVTLATGLVRKIDNISLMDEDKEKRQMAVLRINKMIDHLGAYDSSSKNILIGYVKGELTADSKENKERIKRLTGSLEEILGLAETKKVRLLIEVINHNETNFITNIASGASFVSGFKSDYLKILIDTYHMDIDEKNPSEAIKSASQYIGYVHISDSNRKFPGNGSIDFKPLLAALKDVGYKGYLMLECNEKNNADAEAAGFESRYAPLSSGFTYMNRLLKDLYG